MAKFRQIIKELHVHPAVTIFGCMLAVTALMVMFADSGKVRMMSVLLWTGVVSAVWFLGSESSVHRVKFEDAGRREHLLLILLVTALVLGCILPMGASPEWNGERQNHRDQYERMTESVLKGQLHLDYDIDPRLLEMENPYDVGLRESSGIDYEWDHAFYNGKYYLYFGIVPVFLVFLPYRLITGTALTGYHATQLFTTVGMVGMFALMYLLAKRFFPKMRFATYACLTGALSLLSFWYSSTTPSLYCTAISAAIMLMVWSLYFFTRAVFCTGPEHQNKQIILAFCGAWCGALAFGCRPPVALANLLVIPLLCVFLKQHKMSWKLFGKLFFAASPYIVVAVALMAYNYARFENPFEFGQAYQLTNTDQSAYGDMVANLDAGRIVRGIWENFLSVGERTRTFPYITFSGALVNFPVLALAFGGCNPAVRRKIRDGGLGGWMAMLTAVPLVITIIDIQWAPFLTERYRMDIYFVMALLCFLVVGFWGMSLKTEDAGLRFSKLISVVSFLTIFSCVVFWFIPNDANAVVCIPEILAWAEQFFMSAFTG